MTLFNKSGFTLLEILVALVVITLGLTAVIKTATQNADNISYLRDKTLAHWVAMNVLTELQVRKRWPEVGNQTGIAMMAERKWYWTVAVSETLDQQLRKLEVQVREQETAKEPLVLLVGFIEEPLASSN